MRTKVRITHFAVLGCVYAYNVETGARDHESGHITLSELEAVVAKVAADEPVSLAQGLLVTIYQAYFHGVCSDLLHKNAVIDHETGKLYANGTRVDQDSRYGFIQIKRDEQIEDMSNARNALEEARAENSKKYSELYSLMKDMGWTQDEQTGRWDNVNSPVPAQPTMFDAIKACIVRGNAK